MAVAPATSYADSDGVSIAYQVFGSGARDLVVAPGFMSHLDLQWTIPSFAEFAERLASFARVIIFDKRGTGLSDPAPGADRFDVRMRDIEAVMEAAGSPRAVLFGMSEGGPLAALFAASFPDRVERLVLYGTFARGSAIPDAVYERLADAVAHWGQGRTAEVFSAQANNAFRRRVAGMMERASTSPSMARALLGSIRNADVTAILPSIQVPTMVVNRSGDPFADPAWGVEIAGLIPGATRVELDDDEHTPWLGDVAGLVSVVERFVTGRAQSRAGKRILATVMFTDLVSSTELAAAMGDAAWKALLDQHNRVVRDEVDAHEGREVKFTGDGFLLVFTSPASAIDCAKGLRRRLAALELRTRIGIHTGECEMIDEHELAGVAVHIAARIMALAGADEILVSSTVKDLVIGSQHTFADRGAHQLKGAPGEWHVLEVTDVERIMVDITSPELRVTDRLSLFVARHAARQVRALAGLASPGPSDD